MPTFLVTFPDSPAVPVIGTDEVDAVAGALQSLDSLRDVIALCADTVPEMAAVCERAAPRASAAQPWPEAAAVRAVVGWWFAQHPEIAVAPDTARAAFIRAIPHPKRADCPWHPSGGMVCAHCDDIGLAGVA